MDHSEAAKIKAVEKYILGELPPELRDQFEEHYFDCPECAADIRALARFRKVSKFVLEEEVAAEVFSAEKGPQRGWFAWLRPVFAVPAIALLAAIVIFQATVTIPAWKQRTERQRVTQVYESAFRLQGTTRGEVASIVTIAPNESFGLDFDFIPSKSFPQYTGSLRDSSGRTVVTFQLKAEAANKEQHLVIPGGLVQPGSYQLVFVGEAMENSPAKPEEVQRLSFAIVFTK